MSEPRNMMMCENQGCNHTFRIKSPSDLMEARVMDEHDNEVAERQMIFVCASCQRKYSVCADEGDEWKESV